MLVDKGLNNNSNSNINIKGASSIQYYFSMFYTPLIVVLLTTT